MNLRQIILAEAKVIAKAVNALCAGSLCIGWLLHGVQPVQAYPDRPIKVVVPLPPGGAADVVARVISERLEAILGQAVVVENRAGGAAGAVGTKSVATADPDGYTILVTSGGSLTTGPAVHKNLGYDPFTAFAPVGMLVETPSVLSVNPDVPATTLAELVAHAKANPGKLSWGLQGFGSAPHLFAEMLKLETGIDITLVPYRGTTPMLTAILAGEVQIVSDPMPSSLQHIEAGKLRPLAVAVTRRNERLPNVPTTAEAGHPKLVAPFWMGAVVPAKTPSEVVNRLNAAFREALVHPATRERVVRLGFDIKLSAPAEFGKMLADEFAQWDGVVKAAKIQVQ